MPPVTCSHPATVHGIPTPAAGRRGAGDDQSIAFTMSSTTFLASPNTIIVLGM